MKTNEARTVKLGDGVSIQGGMEMHRDS